MRLSLKLMLAAALVLAASPSADAQLLKELQKKAESTIRQQGNRTVDRAVNDGAKAVDNAVRNGNQQKQARGMAFRSAFEEIIGKIYSEGGAHGKVRNFFNIPR